MERVLVVSPDPWISGEVAALDRERFTITETTYGDALRAYRNIQPQKVIIGAGEDMRRATLLVNEIHGLDTPRAAIILVGLPSQQEVMQQHSTLRKRADWYVVEEAPASLTRAVERATSAPAVHRRLAPYTPPFLAAILLTFTAAILHARGNGQWARVSTIAAAVSALSFEALRQRERSGGGRLFRVAFVAVLIAALAVALWPS